MTTSVEMHALLCQHERDSVITDNREAAVWLRVCPLTHFDERIPLILGQDHIDQFSDQFREFFVPFAHEDRKPVRRSQGNGLRIRENEIKPGIAEHRYDSRI